MESRPDIYNSNEYHINKGFQKHVKVPFSYMIKVVGLDCAPKTSGVKCKETIIKEPNEKFLEAVSAFFYLRALRRKRVRTELKKKRYYERVEQAV